MELNWLLFPTLILALLLYRKGITLWNSNPQWLVRFLVFTLACVLAIPGILFPAYYLHLFDDAIWYYQYRSFPYSELTAAGSGMLAGILVTITRRLKLYSHVILPAVLCIGIIIPYVKPVIGPIPESTFKNRWKDNVSLQSAQSSCGAASTATIFRHFGIRTGEKEIARRAFTYSGGTEAWYLARVIRNHGLKLRFRFQKQFPADLKTPAIAGVILKGNIGHFIPILSNHGNKYITGDPLVGPKEYNRVKLQKAYRFSGFYMEIRK